MRFNLEKEAQRVRFVLQKRNLPEMRAAVGITLDVSGSTQGLYESGLVQGVVQQIIPVALRFDDNQSLDVRTFADGNSIATVAQATAANYEGFVEREVLQRGDVPKWGDTSYAPIIGRMLEEYGFYRSSIVPAKAVGFWKGLFGLGGEQPIAQAKQLGPQSASGEAVVNYFVTDGENDDKDRTYQLLRECQDAEVNMYFLFIGIGRRDFAFLKRIADDFGNVGFLNVEDLQLLLSSDDIYEKLIPEEMTGWLKQKKAA